MENSKLKDIYGPGNDNYGRNKPPFTEKDTCVLCGCETPYPKHMHIDFRMHYVEGAGQLCEECYNKTYFEKPRA